MKPVKIVYVITGLFVGGAERLLLDTVRSLDRKQFEPVVVSFVGGDMIPEFRQCGIRVIDLRMSRAWPWPGVWRLFKLLRIEKPEIIHTHLIHADIFGRVIGWLCGVPTIISTIHMVEEGRHKFPYLFLNRLTVRLNTELIATSENVKKEIAELEHIDPEKIKVIYNAVKDLDPVSGEQIKNLRRAYGINPDEFLLGTISRLEVPRKGHHILFQAIAQLITSYPKLRCVVIGRGAGKDELLAQVRQLGIESHVSFTGEQDNIAEWLAVMDIFVLPSLHEGLPMAIIEAMAASCPIIATRVGGVGELIEHNHSGRLIESGNVGELCQAIEGLMSDAGCCHRMGEAARKSFKQYFEIKHAVAATEDLYRKYIKQDDHSKKIHLLEVVTNFEPGGVPRHVEDLVKHLSRDKFNIGLVSGETIKERIPQLGVPHHYFSIVKPISPLKDLYSLWQLFKLFKKLKPDIVHTHMSKVEALGSVAARLAGVPCIIATIHGQTILTSGFSLKQTVYNFVEWFTIRWFTDKTISVARSTERYLINTGSVTPSRNVTIYNSVAPFSLDKSDRINARKKFGIDDSQKMILMTGRLLYQKTPEILIEACNQLRDRFPNAICLIAGDGPNKQALQEQIDEGDLNSMINLLGHREDIGELLCAADVFVLCTRFEGQSISVLEAMAAGLPVVATNVPGMDELVIPSETGYLIAQDSPRACADALSLILSDSEKECAMGEAAVKRYEKHFNIENQLNKTEEFLWACGQPDFHKNFKFSTQPRVIEKHQLVKEECNV